MLRAPSPGLAPACQARARSSRLTRSSWRTWPHRKLRSRVPRVDGAVTVPPRVCRPSPGAQRIGGVDAVAARRGRRNPGHHLVARVRPPRRAAELKVMVNEFPQAQVPGEGGRQEQAGIGHQAVIVEGDLGPVGVVAWEHLLGASFLGPVFCFKTIIPDSEAHPFVSSAGLLHAVLRWIRVK